MEDSNSFFNASKQLKTLFIFLQNFYCFWAQIPDPFSKKQLAINFEQIII